MFCVEFKVNLKYLQKYLIKNVNFSKNITIKFIKKLKFSVNLRKDNITSFLQKLRLN